MPQAIKILEVKGQDWMAGQSIQDAFAVGGRFQSADNFDPFELMGYLRPSLSSVALDASVITTQINFLHALSSGASGYVFGIGDRSGTGAKQLYRINMADNSVTDYTDQINQNALTGSLIGSGITSYLGRLVYGQSGSLRSNLVTPVAAQDKNILTFAGIGDGSGIRFHVGPDGFLYFLASQTPGVGKIVSVTDTVGNVANAFPFTDTNLVGRDLTSDGNYEIIIADDNFYKVTSSNSRCRVFFWLPYLSKASIIYDIPDTYLIGGRYVNGRVLILGASGLWVCSASTSPKLIFPLSSSKLPSSVAQIDVRGNFLVWASAALGSKVYAYGSTIGPAILSSPYFSSGSTDLHTALAVSGTKIVTATNKPAAYLLNSGITRGSTTISTTPQPLAQPYHFGFTKVVLRTPLLAGQSVTAGAFNGNGQVISDSVTKDQSTDLGKQELIFNLKPLASNAVKFEDIYVTVSSTGADVQRVSTYGTPEDDLSQLF